MERSLASGCKNGIVFEPGINVHRIDSSDRIVGINESWKRFSYENSRAPESVLNHSIWEYVTGLEMTHIHEILLERVRSTQMSLRLPFRCDSPELKRYMVMEMVPLEKASVEYRCHTILEVPRDRVQLLKGANYRSSEMICVCSWCKKIPDSAGIWMEIEDAITIYGLFQGDSIPAISHGICPGCLNLIND